MDPTDDHSYIAIARVTRPRGNRGEVLAELHTDFPERFHVLERVWVEFPDGRRQSFELEDCWSHQGRQVLKFLSIDSISDAEKFVGAWIEIESAQAMPLPEGTYWDRDLIGCVLRTVDGKAAGVVKDVLHIAGNDQLVVSGDRGDYWVPVVAAFCKEISIARKEIIVDLPEGLISLNG